MVGMRETRNNDCLINGGFFHRHDMFDRSGVGRSWSRQPFARPIEKRHLGIYDCLGCWQAMDTFDDKLALDRIRGAHPVRGPAGSLGGVNATNARCCP